MTEKRRARLSVPNHGSLERYQEGCECQYCLAAGRAEIARLKRLRALNPPSRRIKKGKQWSR